MGPGLISIPLMINNNHMIKHFPRNFHCRVVMPLVIEMGIEARDVELRGVLSEADM